MLSTDVVQLFSADSSDLRLQGEDLESKDNSSGSKAWTAAAVRTMRSDPMTWREEELHLVDDEDVVHHAQLRRGECSRKL